MYLSFRHAAFTVVLLFVVFTVHAKTASEVYEQAAKSTVVVENFNNEGEIASFGSGVVLPDGHVVTNCHVTKDAHQLKVRSRDKRYPASLHYSNLDRDVCSLSIVGLGAPAVVVGNTNMLYVGAKVYAIGAPRGLELTLSDGIVSSLREVKGGHYIQTTASISPGSSGGGLFDENGALVGLTTFFITEGQNLNFAVPVEWVTELVMNYLKVDFELAEKKRLQEKFLEAVKAEQKLLAEREEQAELKALAKLKVQAERRAEAERKAEMEQKAEVELKAQTKQKVLAEKKEQAEEKELLAEQKEQSEQQVNVEQERARAEQKAQAEQERARAAQAAAIGREIAEYKAKIIAKIRRNIVMLPDIPYIANSARAEFEVTLLPGGMVLNAILVKPSGSAAYDSAVERAIKKAEPLPLPPDAALFNNFRELRIKFNPVVEYDRLPSCPGSYETETWTNCLGVYTYSSGTKYVGEFKDNKFNGQGTLTLPDGTEYLGEFKNDKFIGQEQDAEKKQVDDAIADHKANDFENGVKRARLAAAQGDAEAQYNLGMMFHKGDGVPQDYVEAIKWVRLAAAQGNVSAQNNLGWMYHNGQGVTQDYAEAVRLYRLAAAQDNATSQNNLGDMYSKGEGVKQDYAEAMKWYRLAAALGRANAQNTLGVMYEKGHGITQNHLEAVKWYRLAAAQGHATSQSNLGVMYAKGQGVPQNYSEAVKWARLSAVQGDAEAQSNLGVMYAEGQGVVQDYVRAHMWFNLGAASGAANSVKNRDIVATMMTSQQIAQAQKMAIDCQQKNFKGCE